MRQRNVPSHSHNHSSNVTTGTSLHNTEYGSADYMTHEGSVPYTHSSPNSVPPTHGSSLERTTSCSHRVNSRNAPTRSRPRGLLTSALLCSLLLNMFLGLAHLQLRFRASHDRDIHDELQKTHRHTHHESEMRIRALLDQQTWLEHELRARPSDAETKRVTAETVRGLTEEKLVLQRKVNDLESHVDVHDARLAEQEGTMRELEVMERRESAYEQRIGILKDKIARESVREALERFGNGPHHVKFEVDLHNTSQPSNDTYPAFTIQMHPLLHMPHSVHLFLEQVRHKLWDGCSFVVNAPHILQAGAHPGSKRGEPFDDKMKPFAEAKLDIVAFQEYSALHPHSQWTVGFAGRPGGPDFYINKIDNTLNHGPGGQEHHEFSEEADPCFGKIVDGFDTIERLMREPHKNAAMGFVFQEPVHIVQATLLSERRNR